MNLREKLESDMKAALKDGNALKLLVLRMLISAIKQCEIDKNIKPPQEVDILPILQRQVKQHKESIEQFKKGNRQDLADKEASELKILESYLPEQLTEEALTALVKAAITEIDAKSKSDMGKVMKLIMEKAKGKCDGKTVNQIIMRFLK